MEGSQMTTPIKSSPQRRVFDQAEIFAEKANTVIKIKQIMLDRKITEVEASRMLSVETNEFKQLIAGDFTNYPLAYLKTLYRRISTGEA